MISMIKLSNLKYYAVLFCQFLFLIFVYSIDASAADKTKFTLVHVNDMDKVEPYKDRGGVAKLAAVLKKERSDNKVVFFTMGGDTISPSILSTLDHGKHMIDLYHELKLDYMTLGNHEFDFGPDVAKKWIAQAKFPILSANVFEADHQRIAGTVSSAIREVDGFKIGFIGLTTPETKFVSAPGYVTFDPVVESAREAVKDLKEKGADFIVALCHLTIMEDMALMRANLGIDFILGGHDEVLLTFYDSVTGLMISKSQAEYISVVDIDLERKDYHGVKEVEWTPHFRVVDSETVTPDPEMKEKIASLTKEMHAKFDVPIGKTLTELDSRRAKVRESETALGNLIADSFREKYKADVAIVNGGGLRGNKVYQPDTQLTMRDIYTELPFGKHIAVVELNGKELRRAIEVGLASIKGQSGGFPQVSGMTYVFDAEKKKGERLVEIKVAGEPLDDTKNYKVVINEYLFKGGENYDMFQKGKTVVKLADTPLEAVIVVEYIKKLKEIAPKVEGRIKRLH